MSDSVRVYGIGDIHGRAALLETAHKLIERDGGREARVIHVGDLTDRGPNSRAVINQLLAGLAKGRDWHVVLGNHDRLFRNFLTDPTWIDLQLSQPVHWIDHSGLGAGETLASYGVDLDHSREAIHIAASKSVPAEHLTFLNSLPLWHLEPQALFVHAGIRPGVDLHDQTEDDLVWIRRPFLESTADHGVLVVHGHTPVDQVEHHGNRLAIDTGAAYGGPLTTVVIEPDGSVFRLTPAGRVAVAPAV